MVRFSRHSRRRMSLYEISPDDVRAVLECPDQVEIDGTRKSALRSFSGKFSGYPLKVVTEEEDGESVVITAYPVKKALKR